MANILDIGHQGMYNRPSSL